MDNFTYIDAKNLLTDLEAVLRKRAPDISSLEVKVVLNPPLPVVFSAEYDEKTMPVTSGTIVYDLGVAPSIRFYSGVDPNSPKADPDPRRYFEARTWLPHVPEAQWMVVLAALVRAQAEYRAGPPLRTFLNTLKRVDHE